MKRLPSIIPLLLCVALLTSMAWAQSKYDIDPIAIQARNVAAQGKYAEALALYETLEQKYPVQTQDEVGLLLTASSYALKAGDKERAFAICERAMKIPAQQGAHPPAMMPGPLDLRGEARWQMAEIRRSQARWAEALELYQLNRQTYPRNDGCTPCGAAFQRMAMVEGECLEHLGRFDEAVALYFGSALNLDFGIKPMAMRRLIDIYQGANQLEVLERNLAREKALFDEKVERDGGELELTEREYYRETKKVYSPFARFERIRQFRNLARLHRWDDLIQILNTSATNDLGNESEVTYWNLIEVLAALLKLDVQSRNEALKALQTYLKRNPFKEAEVPNAEIAAAISVLQRDKSKATGTDTGFKERQRDELFQYANSTSEGSVSYNLAPIPPNLKLPTLLAKEKSRA